LINLCSSSLPKIVETETTIMHVQAGGERV